MDGKPPTSSRHGLEPLNAPQRNDLQDDKREVGCSMEWSDKTELIDRRLSRWLGDDGDRLIARLNGLSPGPRANKNGLVSDCNSLLSPLPGVLLLPVPSAGRSEQTQPYGRQLKGDTWPSRIQQSRSKARTCALPRINEEQLCTSYAFEATSPQSAGLASVSDDLTSVQEESFRLSLDLSLLAIKPSRETSTVYEAMIDPAQSANPRLIQVGNVGKPASTWQDSGVDVRSKSRSSSPASSIILRPVLGPRAIGQGNSDPDAYHSGKGYSHSLHGGLDLGSDWSEDGGNPEPARYPATPPMPQASEDSQCMIPGTCAANSAPQGGLRLMPAAKEQIVRLVECGLDRLFAAGLAESQQELTHYGTHYGKNGQASHNEPHGSLSSQSHKKRSRGNRQSDEGKETITDDDDNDDDDDNGGERPHKREKHEPEDKSAQGPHIFACCFLKRDPEFKLHRRLDNCHEQEASNVEIVHERKLRDLKKPKRKYTTDYDHWFEIYHILFPGATPSECPASPYHPLHDEALRHRSDQCYATFAQSEVRGILGRELDQLVLDEHSSMVLSPEGRRRLVDALTRTITTVGEMFTASRIPQSIVTSFEDRGKNMDQDVTESMASHLIPCDLVLNGTVPCLNPLPCPTELNSQWASNDPHNLQFSCDTSGVMFAPDSGYHTGQSSSNEQTDVPRVEDDLDFNAVIDWSP
ncbi:hypothetical protein BJ170DRAFT_735495 [Xylariales sp. AK1849]|nr:hypothetical protein BJ170DRAFT_735495 [Xylariales sp. AK1849]